MTTLHDIQRHLVERIGCAPVGSTLRFRLMDAADAVSKAMEAEEAQAAAGRPPLTSDTAARLRRGDRILIDGRLIREFDRLEGGYVYATSSNLGHPPESCVHMEPAQ